MAKIKKIIVEAVLPAFKTIGKIEMTNVLSSIRQHNTSETYRNTLQGLYSNFSLLKEVASKSKTKIDDGIVNLVLEAVTESAEADGVILS